MAGASARFLRAGYAMPKFLIPLGKQTMIETLVENFSNEERFVFIVNKKHLENNEWNLEDLLRTAAGSKTLIVGIEEHKWGPVYSILAARNHLNLEEDAIVTYCDVAPIWNWHQVKRYCRDSDVDELLFAYSGFHPHNLRRPSHGHIRTLGYKVLEIREKASFTSNPENEWASAGVYWFRSTKQMLKALEEQLMSGATINGEHYVSLTYDFLGPQKSNAEVYEISKFRSWGTPEELEDYQYYADIFTPKASSSNQVQLEAQGLNVVVLGAGDGSRFSSTGEKINKAAIEINETPMILKAAEGIPDSAKTRFLLRSDLDLEGRLQDEITKARPLAEVIMIEGSTKGQALSAVYAATAQGHKFGAMSGPIMVMPCDATFKYRDSDVLSVITNETPTIGIFVAQGYPPAAIDPTAYSWVSDLHDGKIKTFVKSNPPDPSRDFCMTGAFVFSDVDLLTHIVSQNLEEAIRNLGEAHLDYGVKRALEAGVNAIIIESTNFVSWGTPKELKVYEYWAEYFADLPRGSAIQIGEQSLSSLS